MSDLPSSVIEARPTDNTSQWLKNLDVDFEVSDNRSTTPSSIRTDPVSTPALPAGVEESEGTATPQRFKPEDDDGARTISDVTYDKIRTSPSKKVSFFFSPFEVFFLIN